MAASLMALKASPRPFLLGFSSTSCGREHTGLSGSTYTEIDATCTAVLAVGLVCSAADRHRLQDVSKTDPDTAPGTCT